MNFASVIATAVLLLSGVATVGKFYKTIRNQIIAQENDLLSSDLIKHPKLPEHLAYLAEHHKKIAVDSEEKMGALMTAIKYQKFNLKDMQLSLENELKCAESERKQKNAFLNFLNSKRFNEECDLKHKMMKKASSDIENFNKFLKYCPNGEWYRIVANYETPVNFEESAVATASRFDLGLRNQIIRYSNINYSMKLFGESFYSHLAYLTEKTKKVAVSDKKTMETFINFVKSQKDSLEKDMKNLEMELKAHEDVIEEIT